MKNRKLILTFGFIILLFISIIIVVPSIKYTIYKILPVNIRWKISYALTDKFLIGMIYFVENDNSLLLVKQTYQNKWGLPGGWLNKNESFAECAQRELFEELGAKVSNIRIIEIHKVPKAQVIDIVIKCTINNSDIGINDNEISRFSFFKKDSLPNGIIHTHKPYIERYLFSNKNGIKTDKM
ncbi:MAG: NUDIX domain-containing protein [Chitinispirillia bacterium]|jgi:8-oxo-dGTP pyrophosphatase MutT (NUDIX family)